MNTLISFDRFPLIFRPTPLHFLPRLSHALGDIEVWAKREDCNGLAGGGNKARKLEYLVADALAQGCRTLVTVGGLQSNHTRITAAAAAAAGMKCVLVQRHWGTSQAPEYEKVGNVLLAKILGAKSHIASGSGRVLTTDREFIEVIKSIESDGGKPYAIPAGASDHRLGGLGFVDGIQEVLAQADDQKITFDAIICATSSGSTQAGILAGLHLKSRNIPVIGVCVNDNPETTREVVHRVANSTSKLLGGSQFLESAEIQICEEFMGQGYGIPSSNTIISIETLAQLEGILVDPVYEGKAIEGLLALNQQGRFQQGSKVLWWHLGGAQALHAYTDKFLVHNATTRNI